MKWFKSVLAVAAIAVAAPAFAQQSAPKPQTLFTNVHVFDGVNEKRIMNANVLVEGNLIKAVSTTKMDAPGATVVDGGGRTLMPGLIDAHWHVMFSEPTFPELLNSDISWLTLLGARGARDTLSRGFTTVRDVGGSPFAIKKAIDKGMLEGPRIYPSGPNISQTSGHSDGRHPADPGTPVYLEKVGQLRIANGVPDVLAAVRESLRMGASQIKLSIGGGVSSPYDPLDVSQYTLEELKAAVDAAKSWNTYVAVHANTDASIRMAIEAGALTIEHGFLLEEDTLKLMAQKGIWLSIQPLLNDEDAFPFTGENQRKWIQVTDGTDRVYKLAKQLKVKIAFGTDLLFDPTLGPKQGKFLAKLKCWFTPYEALKIATSTNAELLALSGPRNPYQAGPLGVVKEGAYADLILVNGNPLENLDLVASSSEELSCYHEGWENLQERGALDSQLNIGVRVQSIAPPVLAQSMSANGSAEHQGESLSHRRCGQKLRGDCEVGSGCDLRPQSVSNAKGPKRCSEAATLGSRGDNTCRQRLLRQDVG